MADRPSAKALSDFISEAQENIEALDRDLLRLEDTRHGQEAEPDSSERLPTSGPDQFFTNAVRTSTP